MQPITFHRGRAIIAGLGNFVFHTRRPATYDEKGVDVWRSAAIRLTLADDGTCERLELLPISVGRPVDQGLPPGPVPLQGSDADEIRERALAGLPAADRQRVV
jgi:poly-gamma-glutamate synthesis protein (capsule biosynthesis protein)